jgi:SAM-dependent methyltransferase
MSTETATIQRQYNDIIASHYDLDPQGVTGGSLDRAVEQLRQHHLIGDGAGPLDVLDLGMGTGLFLAKLKAVGGDLIHPFGLDLAARMVEVASRKLPDLVAEVGDAAAFDAQFPGRQFDLVCTHFITGFVPMGVLAPKIHARLEEGGYWSIVAGLKVGFPALQAKSDSKVLRWLVGAGSQRIPDALCNPTSQREVEETFAEHGFEVCAAETFEPALDFRSFQDFMDFAYRGGWLTPLIEAVGLHQAGPLKRWFINRWVFPVKDHHSITIALGRKIAK